MQCALMLALAMAPAAGMSEGNLLQKLVGKKFVVPGAQGQPVDLVIRRTGRQIFDIVIAGQVTDEYRVLPNGHMRRLLPAAPATQLDGQVTGASWSYRHRNVTTTFTLNSFGDIEARRTGEVEDWMDRRFTYAFAADRPELAIQLKLALRRIHAEAERYEGHVHGDEEDI